MKVRWTVIARGFLFWIAGLSLVLAGPDGPQLLRNPTVHGSQIAFAYGGDLWVAPLAGGTPRRLTTGVGNESRPFFSPDGKWVAFTGEYDGNQDVYVVAASGGIPKRLTYHPGPDETVGWTPDGNRILFNSPRQSYSYFPRLFTIPADGGDAEALPLPMGEEGCFSPDGKRLAYVPTVQWQKAWKRYRGGQTKKIWIVDLADSAIEAEIPRENSNDFNPMWIGETVYFLSDRNGPVSLFAYDIASKAVRQVVENQGLDLKAASADGSRIVYEQFGSLHLFNVADGDGRILDLQVGGDLPQVRPHFERIKPAQIRSAGISPNGARAMFGARGEVLTVPAEKGDIRNLTSTVAVSEIYPAWSPDGQSIAYFSDESGEYELHIRDQGGLGPVTRIPLGDPPTFYYSPVWSPDSRKIAYSDKRLNIWYVDLEKPEPARIDRDTYADPNPTLVISWSPDSRWIAYTRQLVSHLHAVFVYSLEEKLSRQVTDGMSDALFPRFDRDGKYLYFTASTDMGLTPGWLDMSSLNHPVTRSAYVAVLRKDLPSPLAPESDEEKTVRSDAAEPDNKEEEEKPAPVAIDFDGLSQRILTLPIPARNYLALEAGKAGVLFLVEGPPVMAPEADADALSLAVQQFDLKTRKVEKILDDVQRFELADGGEKMLFLQNEKWTIAPAGKLSGGAPKPGEGGILKLDAMQVYVDPKAEWKHMFEQVWRGERDFFYDPGLHGVDIEVMKARYEPFLDGLSSRDDLNYLFEEMLGELTVGHMFVGGGDYPEVKKVKGGLLGADYVVENGRYRFARIFNGENWNPKLVAPLTQPGVNVQEGEYLLAVNGRELNAGDNLYRFFEETAGAQVVLKVGPDPDGQDARTVTVVPVASESGLRNLAWIEGNRRTVDELTNGRVAYVYLPDTYAGGYTNFNRYYFAQVGKDAAIIDERFNGGGDVADYVIDLLRRPLMNYFTMREGKDITTPIEAIFGPKVMIINELAGSGGDAMPWLFRRAGVGPLVGKRTWGGLVGHYTSPGDLLDGGHVGTPNLAFYSPDGIWDVENHGVPPDIEVEMDPKLVREGHDPQLERAVEEVLELLKDYEPPTFTRPPYPNYQEP